MYSNAFFHSQEVFHSAQLFGLRGAKNSINETMAELGLPLNVDDAFSTNELVSTAQSVSAAHS